MLRLFHTADWHLGQLFHGHSRDREHERFLQWLLAALRERRPDALVVAGDVFDSVNPSASSQRLLYRFLAEAHEELPHLQVVLTAGNHDAAARLEAPAELFRKLRISLIGTIWRRPDGTLAHEKLIVPLCDAAGRVCALVLAIPFLRPSDVPVAEPGEDAYGAGIRELYRAVLAEAETLRREQYPGASLIALGHCHLQGGAESRDSERRLLVGGVEGLQADCFPAALAYVALGHLHRAQQFEGGRIRYSGSPIPLSFSEMTYEHSVLEVEITREGAATAQLLPVPRSTLLLRLPPAAAPLEEVLAFLAEHPFSGSSEEEEEHPFLEVRVLEEGPDPTRHQRLQAALAGKGVRLVSLRLEAQAREGAAEPEALPAQTLEDLHALDPEAILIAAHQEQFRSAPDLALLRAFREVLTAESREGPPSPP